MNENLQLFASLPVNVRPRTDNEAVFKQQVNRLTKEGLEAATISDLSTFVKQLEGAGLVVSQNKIVIKAIETVVVDDGNNELALFSGGKLSANLINAKQIVADGLKANTFDAGNATINNLIVTNAQVTGKITATSGSVGGFAINDSSIGSANSSGSIKGMSLSKQQIIFNTQYGQGIFGSFFMTGGYCYGARITLDSGDFQNNIGAYIEVNCRDTIYNNRGLDIIADGGSTSLGEKDNYGNHAIWAEKGCYAGFRPKITLANKSRTLSEMECFISCKNSSGITLTLPSSPQLGQYYKVLRLGDGNVTITSGSSNIRFAKLNYKSNGYVSDGWSTANNITASYKNMTIELVYDGTYWCANYYRQMVI